MSQPPFLAPIVLFVYNRPWHTRQTIEALQKNELAIDSDLFIYADGPKKPEDIDKVREVRKYINTIDGFKTVSTVARDENLGLASSIIAGVTEVVKRFGRIIVLEDDLITSPYFLRYMNDALELYKDEEQVAAIHGYSFPLCIELPDTFFLRNTGCWGWGTWRRAWALFEADGRKLLDQLKHSQLTKCFDMNGAYKNSRMLKAQANGKIDSWAVRWHASTFVNNKLNLYPGISLVKNIGHDGSGVHCGKSRFYDVNMIDTAVSVYSIPVCENLYVKGCLESFFRKGHPGVLRYWVRKLFGNLLHSLLFPG